MNYLCFKRNINDNTVGVSNRKIVLCPWLYLNEKLRQTMNKN